MHGGRVWVEDRRDGAPGARFVIELLGHRAADGRRGRRRRRRRRESRRPMIRSTIAVARWPRCAPSRRARSSPTRRLATSRQASGRSSIPSTRRPARRTGSSRIFLLTSDEDSGERLLRSVLRDVDPTPTAVLEELFKGPNQQELEAGLRTALPDGPRRCTRPAPVAGTLERRRVAGDPRAGRLRSCASPSPRSCSRPASSRACATSGCASTARSGPGPTGSGELAERPR